MSLSVSLIRQTESFPPSLSLRLSQSQFFCWHLAEITSARGTEEEEEKKKRGKKKGNSPELVAECNPSLPSRKHQHVIILTAAALQLTVMHTREILLVAVRGTLCQQHALQNRDTNKMTVN